MPPETLNRFLVGNRQGKVHVVILMRRTHEGLAPLELDTSEAVNLAAWLVVMTKMTSGVDAFARVSELVSAIERT
jgi:hypothetical protein